MIDKTQFTAHQYAGKFEGESPATEYYQKQQQTGGGEPIVVEIHSPVEQTDSDDALASVFQINADEAEAFGLHIGWWFLFKEDNNGFAYGTEHETKLEAEKHFRSWLGM